MIWTFFPTHRALLIALLAAAFVSAGCPQTRPDDDDATLDDDDATADDDDTTGDDDDATADDDDATADDDDATADDDDATGDDDDATADDDDVTPIPDEDGDGFDATEDCNDQDPAIHPDAEEICNDLDDDCDGSVDEGLAVEYFTDADGDGYGDPLTAELSCAPLADRVEDSQDCDDTDPAVHPGATEVCDGVDNDCGGGIDTGLEVDVFADADGDGYGDPNAPSAACGPGDGFVLDDTDCNDTDNTIYPLATETCDGKDNNCDGQADEGVTTTWYQDSDTDGYGDATVTQEGCSAPSGFVADSSDCNDEDPASYPGAAELCDELDNNCDGSVDEGVSELYYPDADGDGFGADSPTVEGCSLPENYSTQGGDCDDGDVAINPAAIEVCDSLDNNCDGAVDETGLTTFYPDLDGDGFGTAAGALDACSAPADTATLDGDCDDTEASTNPGASELCDGIDNNCDGTADEGVTVVVYPDSDGDGFGDGGAPSDRCADGGGFVFDATDCDDTEATVFPGNAELCDGLDNNCDGAVDEGVQLALYEDLDGDGYGDAFLSAGCSAGTGQALTNDDCVDTNPDIHPGAEDIPGDGIDQNCDGVDPSLPVGQVCLASDSVATLGAFVEGTLDGSSPSDGPRSATAYWDTELTLNAGVDVTIEMHSEDFDTYLYVLDQNCAVVASDDDGGVGLSSTLLFAAATDGVYTVVATAFSSSPSDQYGAFRMRISQGDAGGACLAGSDVVGMGEDMEVSLGSFSSDSGPRGAGFAYQDYGIYLQAGEALTAQLTSFDFDAYIAVLDSSCTVLAEDDGLSYTQNSRLAFTAPSAGNYTLVFGTDEPGGTGFGQAQVAMGTLGNHCFSNTAHATLPREYLDKELTAFDPTEGGPLGSGYAWDDYEFVAGPTEGLSVHAVSLDADLFLAAYDETCSPFASTPGDGTGFSGEVGISTTPASWAQVMTVAVSAANPGDLGRTLVGAANIDGWNRCGTDNRGLMLNELVHGAIDSTDDGSGPLGGNRWDDFELVLEQGDSIDLVVDATAFNPALAILDGNCALVASNRDGATNDGASLAWQAPEDGVYTVVVEAEDANASGEYYMQYSRAGFEGCSDWSDSDVIAPGLSDFDGTLEATDESGYRTSFGLHYHDDIDLFLYAGQQVQIDLGGSLDNYLYLLDDNCTQVASDDDSGPGLDAMMVYTAPTTGVYTILASTWNAQATGPYALSVTALNEF